MQEKRHTVDFCVIGGGLAGMSAAITAARHGAKVLLMQDRPVLGGNASSEIRMWVCGAHGDYNRETGIIEEIMLENLYRNQGKNWSLWDSVLYEKVKYEDNITLLLNCSCNEAKMEDNKIKSVKGWQLTTETWHTVEAGLFADCSGDSILAPLTGAEFRIGREASSEFNESIEPEQADDKTMGMSCLIQARETDRPQTFVAPDWAYTYKSDQELPNRGHDISKTNFWWIEVGGEKDTIHDTEELRDELLKIALGVWDHIKNQGDHGAENWQIEWMGFLPGKRESRRYVGDYILNQNDVRAEGRFDDLVAYGGWSMDDHHPAGFNYPGEPTIFHPAPSPFGIPYRSLYSKNIENLFFAGRNISATHAAMSASRVMATCATLGQAVGTAAAIAIDNQITPRGVYKRKIEELKQTLLTDDCYLPWNKYQVSALSMKAKLNATEDNTQILRNGIERPLAGEMNYWQGSIGSSIEYSFDKLEEIKQIRFVFDSDLKEENNGHRHMNMPCKYPLDVEYKGVPETMLRKYKVEILDDHGQWQKIIQEENNYQRLVKYIGEWKTKAIKFTPEKTWGSKKANIFSWDLN